MYVWGQVSKGQFRTVQYAIIIFFDLRRQKATVRDSKSLIVQLLFVPLYHYEYLNLKGRYPIVQYGTALPLISEVKRQLRHPIHNRATCMDQALIARHKGSAQKEPIISTRINSSYIRYYKLTLMWSLLFLNFLLCFQQGHLRGHLLLSVRACVYWRIKKVATILHALNLNAQSVMQLYDFK